MIGLVSVKHTVSDCRNIRDIDPCVCLNNRLVPNKISINCVGDSIDDYNIDTILDQLNQQLLTNPELILDSFRLTKTSVTVIDDNYFGVLPFVDIEITDNPYLRFDNFTDSSLLAAASSTLKMFYAASNDLIADGVDGSELLKVFNSFASLESLTLKDIGIDRIARNTFDNQLQVRLRFIDLSDNRISHIDEYAFFELRNLRSLKLDNNSLVTLAANSLAIRLPSPVPMLLSLNANRLSAAQLSPIVFDNLQRPLILLIKSNQLDYFPESVFRQFIESDDNYFVDVGDNQFVCDCQRHRWLFLMKPHLRSKVINMYCNSAYSIWHYEDVAETNCF
ncbi:uncharacterized protein LOC128957016 [Oppia nitens]|uniref:uncharacterized protein LOC128957016 n=1 Tax=Oppia nitens TaxID=1686743 RepID=UPI0023D9CAF6|nr:uncharacterized protein LOC128957016 [Oppia nitens]